MPRCTLGAARKPPLWISLLTDVRPGRRKGIILPKDVIISIQSSQAFEGCETDEINLITKGRLYQRNGKTYISYEESELTGLEGTKTTVKLEPGQVTLIRTGKSPSRMLFAQDERHVGLYQTPYGALTIATHTSNIKNTMGADGGGLALDYTIEVEHNVTGVNHFEMDVRRA